MRANELRIGNWVNALYGLPIQVDRDDFAYHSGLGNIEGFSPVPLTEQWLKDFGFEEEYRSEFTIRFTHKTKHEIGYDWNKSFNWRFRFYGTHLECAYVHQLQNLYFALTGNELVKEGSQDQQTKTT